MSEEKSMGQLTVAYRCKVCDKPVEVTANPGKEPTIQRSCEHDGATVIAWISGTLARVTTGVKVSG